MTVYRTQSAAAEVVALPRHGASLGRLAVQGLRAVLEFVTIRLEAANARHRLRRLDDRLLEDIGLCRADIDLRERGALWRDLDRWSGRP